MILLYVDDSETMQQIAAWTLAGSDFEYVGARSADEGLRLAAERKPDLILADAMMPGKNGYDLCRAVRADLRLAAIPVLIVCGNSQAYDPGRGAEVGADGSIAKPWDSQVLLDKLTEHLERGGSARPAAAAPAAAPAAGARSPSIMGMPSIKLPPGIAAPSAPADVGTFDDDVSVDLSQHLGDVRREDAGDAVRMSRSLQAVEVPQALLDQLAEQEAVIAGRAEPAKNTDKPLYVDENVQFTIYRPKAMPPAKWHALLAFAHLAEKRDDEDESDPIEEVQRQARQVLGEDAGKFADTTQDSRAAIPAEGELTITPELPGFDVNPKARTFLWTESVHKEEFRIRAPARLDGQTVRGKMTVWLGSLIVAEVPLAIRVSSGAGIADAKPTPAKARPYRKIFASYSHRDGHIVDEVSRLARALGDEYIRDWVHLRTGQVWNDQLRTLIAEADIFQLFWSQSSMRSKFCKEEWEYALSLDRPTFVRPTYWEDPMPSDPGASMPPESLTRLHFQKIRVGTDPAPPPPRKDDGVLFSLENLAALAAADGAPPTKPGPESQDLLDIRSMASAYADQPAGRPYVMTAPVRPARSNQRSMILPVLLVALLAIAAIVGWLLMR